MVTRIDCDKHWQKLRDGEHYPRAGALPRRTRYGHSEAAAPYGDRVDELVSPSDYKEVIAHCHADQIFPLYHQYNTWCPKGSQWNQNGLNYCWAWGIAASLMDCEAREGKRKPSDPLLSPVSLGWTVGWRNDGNYLESAISGIKERGVCTQEYTPDVHSRSYRRYRDGWEANALQHRALEFWDLDNTRDERMVQHSISILATGTPIYIAYNWWGHALMCTGVRWDESVQHNVVWQIRNSHNETDIIELSGNRGVFDEAYGLRASRTDLE